MKAVIRLLAVMMVTIGLFGAEARGAGSGKTQTAAGFDSFEHLFGNDVAFTATQVMSMTKDGKPQMETETRYAVDNGNVGRGNRRKSSVREKQSHYHA
jgi:hypothetical protein